MKVWKLFRLQKDERLLIKKTLCLFFKILGFEPCTTQFLIINRMTIITYK